MSERSLHFSIILLLLLASLTSSLSGQDVGKSLERLGRLSEQQLNITGGIRFNTNFYATSGFNERRDPFQWTARARLNFNFLGVNAPFTFAFSDANQVFNLPSYTFTGISPRYKWATLHAGDRSLNLSRFTMSGISFRGAGIELEPGRFRFAAFSGVLNRALLKDLNAVGNLNGYFQRNAWGGRIGYEGNTGAVTLALFSANDDDENNPLTTAGNLLTPLANKVVSLSGRQAVGKKLAIRAELAHSATNTDKTAPALNASEQSTSNRLLGLFTPNQSIITGQALDLSANYSLKKSNLNFGYERINRGFRTLGALFFNNDSERFTTGLSRSFFAGKLNLIANGGLERLNLDAQDNQTTDRIIASLTANYRPTDRWNLNGTYSNFRNDTKLRGRTDLVNPVDSIFLAQLTQSLSGTLTRTFGAKERPAVLTFALNHQRANNIINDEVNPTSMTRFTNAMLGFTAGDPAGGLRYDAAISTSFTMLAGFNSRTFSPSAGVSNSFLNNQLTTAVRTALSLVTVPDFPERDNTVFNLALTAGYKLRNAHTLNASVNYINRFGAEQDIRNFNEWYGSLAYGFRFGGKLFGAKSVLTSQ
ncbi:MAG: hypothetical protein AAF840_00620 [Bacteroidota bacterium]